MRDERLCIEKHASCAHLAVLPDGVEADACCEVSERLARPSPVLEEEQHRLQYLLDILQRHHDTNMSAFQVCK